jgi:hypothetical protein
MFHTIGEAAGEIWRLLRAEEQLSVSAIVHKTKHARAMVYMAIGWLAREDKLVFTPTKRGMFVSLKK